MSRPAEHYLHGGGTVVVVPARVAAWLCRHGLGSLRAVAAGADPEVDAVLTALALSADGWRTSAVTEAGAEVARRPAEVPAPLTVMTTQQAADLLRITDRAVRLAITQRRLPAQRVDGRWLIDLEDLDHFRGRRTA